VRVTRLRCEHREDIVCVDHPAPRLGWTLESDRRDDRQSAYRILVARDPAELAAERGTLWDSGRVASGRTVDVAYGGRPLPPAAELIWAVRVWDAAGAASEWSVPARFRTALDDWQARWIRRDPAEDPGVPVPTDEPVEALEHGRSPVSQLRREFTVAAGPRRATLYACARGVVELQLNGERVGDAVLAPGWTDYRERIEYAAHDVTEQVREGANALGAILGEGWYAGHVGFNPKRQGNWYGVEPELLCELHLEHSDGSVQVVAGDGAWRATGDGPIRSADLLHGERYDARLERDGWSAPGFDDAAWPPVLVRDRDGVRLVPERGQPVRVTEDVPAVALTSPAPGVHVFDLGQNIVGWARLAVAGTAGTTVRMRFAEMLEPDGTLHTANLRLARQEDVYVLRGGGPEVHEPRFTFHGFRFVELTGLPETPALAAITGRVVHSDMPVTGAFACSHPGVERLMSNIVWGQRGNFVSVPTDCPQRDERLGWLADAQVFLPTATLNMDVAAFMTKWGDDVLDAQSEEGAYPDVAPRLVTERDGAPAWADAGVIVPWVLYRRYGDLRLVERHWPYMERYMAYLLRHNPDLLWTARRNNDYGDWLSVGLETPREVLATAYFAHDAGLMAEMARALRLDMRAAHYDRLRDGIRAAWNRAYVDADGRIEGDTQTVYLLALHMDLLPAARRADAARRLVEKIEANGDHLDTGFIGVGLLCPVLTEAGYGDVAHRLLVQDSYPSWLYSIRHGATTIWERWDGWTEQRGFQTANMNSFNHYALGSVGEWLYEYVAGIRPAKPGYEEVLVAPVPGSLEHARATYRSVRGEIASAWRRDGVAFELEVTIPPNVSATVIVPGGGELSGDGEGAPGVRAVTRAADAWRVRVGSGRYRFRTE
jgi:alpha-L-rhamnosidase